MRDTAPPGVQLHGASAALGTRHRKEEQIGPALASLGLLVRAEDIDTDALGTFDGRVACTLTPLAAAEAKARGAARAAGTRFGLGSEGSFFADPDLPWCTTDLELVTFVDLGTDLVVTGRVRRPAWPGGRAPGAAGRPWRSLDGWTVAPAANGSGTWTWPDRRILRPAPGATPSFIAHAYRWRQIVRLDL